MADQRYRVMVVELDDVKPRNESGLENLLTLVTVSTPPSWRMVLRSFNKSIDWRPR